MDPVIYYPKRPMAQCHLWDCERGELLYCSVEHEFVAISDESIDKALVFVDGIDFNVMDLRSQKVLGLKALDEENCCGIPYLEADILNQTPWDTIEFPFILEETETSRVWVFSSDNTRPGEIWRNVGGRRLGEIAISSWGLYLDHPAGKFKLRKYSREEVHGAVYWLIFMERLSRSLTRFREVVTMDNASPVSRDNANANIIGLLTQPLCATHLTMNHAQESKTLVNKLSGILEDLTAKVTAWEEERAKEFLYGGVRVLTMLEQYKTLWEDKELEKQSQGDQKKLHGLVITEQEALYNKSGKNPLTTPVTTAAVNRELSLGALHAAVNRELSLGALHAAHLTMNHAEESQILVNKLSGMVEDKEFLDGDVRVLTMLEQLKTLWEEKELGKQRQRDQKKLHEQVITEQEALSNKSGKNPLTTPVTTAAVNRELSLGALPHQSLKPEKAALSSKRTTYCDENAKNSTLPTPSGKRNSMRRNPLSPLEFESYEASW